MEWRRPSRWKEGELRSPGQPRRLSPRKSKSDGVVRSSGVLPVNQFAPAAYSVCAVFLWGASDFSGGYASRRANAFVLTAFSHVCALVLMFVIAFGVHGEFLSRRSIVWAVLAGMSGGFSLAIFYRALAAGKMGL